MTDHIGFAEVAQALEDQIRRARFRVQVSDENPAWAYAVDEPPDPPEGWTVLSCSLPLAEARRRVDDLRARPFKYTWMKSTAGLDYLGFGAAVIHSSAHGKYKLVMVPAEHALWQISRLQSGLQNALSGLYDTAAEAIVEMAEAQALGVL